MLIKFNTIPNIAKWYILFEAIAYIYYRYYYHVVSTGKYIDSSFITLNTGGGFPRFLAQS